MSRGITYEDRGYSSECWIWQGAEPLGVRPGTLRAIRKGQTWRDV